MYVPQGIGWDLEAFANFSVEFNNQQIYSIYRNKLI